jgi:hypothetical protein
VPCIRRHILVDEISFHSPCDSTERGGTLKSDGLCLIGARTHELSTHILGQRDGPAACDACERRPGEFMCTLTIGASE